MMKKILLVSLIATTGLIGVHKMNQPTTGSEADLVVTNYWVTGDDAPMDYENGYSAKVGMGNQANFAVPDLTTEEGLDFGISFVNGYYCDGACVGSENKVVVRGSETDVANYYTDDTENLVCVIDTNNKLVGMAGIDDGETIDSLKIDSFKGSLTAPAGYTIDTNLYYDDGTVFEAGVTPVNDNMILKSKLTYNDSYKTFAVDVTSAAGTATATNEEDESGATVDVKFDKMVTLTSTNENFSYWTVNDTIVSYESTYTFSVYSNVSVVEVVGETEFTAAPVINLYTTDDSDTDMDNLFVCGFSLLPEGNTLVEAGMLFGGTTFEDAASKVVANTISENNEFAVKYDGDDKDTNVAYLVYKDSLGAISTVYSAVVADEPEATPVTANYAFTEGSGENQYTDGEQIFNETLPGDDNLVYNFIDGSTETRFWNGSMRIYDNGYIEIFSSYPITSYNFTYDASKYYGVFEVGESSASIQETTNTSFEPSENIKYIKISNNGSQQCRIKSWSITYLM